MVAGPAAGAIGVRPGGAPPGTSPVDTNSMSESWTEVKESGSGTPCAPNTPIDLSALYVLVPDEERGEERQVVLAWDRVYSALQTWVGQQGAGATAVWTALLVSVSFGIGYVALGMGVHYLSTYRRGVWTFRGW